MSTPIWALGIASSCPLSPGGVVGTRLNGDLVALDPPHWQNKACAIAGRNLTTTEWTKYIGPLDRYHAICAEFPLST